MHTIKDMGFGNNCIYTDSSSLSEGERNAISNIVTYFIDILDLYLHTMV